MSSNSSAIKEMKPEWSRELMDRRRRRITNFFNFSMDITSAFNAPILAAFAYGSAINTAENDSSVQTDYILIVEDTKAFHSLTKRQYPCHYSAIMKALPPRYLSYLNDTIPAGLFFHPYVSFDNDVFGHNVFLAIYFARSNMGLYPLLLLLTILKTGSFCILLEGSRSQ